MEQTKQSTRMGKKIVIVGGCWLDGNLVYV